MRYTITIDYDLFGFILKKYTNKGLLKNTYYLYPYDKDGSLSCSCFSYQREKMCKHVRWISLLMRLYH